MRVKCKVCNEHAKVTHVCGCSCGSFITTKNFDQMGFSQEIPTIEYLHKTGENIRVSVNPDTNMLTVFRDDEPPYRLDLNNLPDETA